MPCSQFTDCGTNCLAFDSFLHEITDHFYKASFDSSRPSPMHSNPSLFTDLSGFLIKIEHDLHVITDESNRNDDDTVKFLFVIAGLDCFTDIRLKPGLLRWPTAALLNKIPLADTT